MLNQYGKAGGTIMLNSKSTCKRGQTSECQ